MFCGSLYGTDGAPGVYYFQVAISNYTKEDRLPDSITDGESLGKAILKTFPNAKIAPPLNDGKATTQALENFVFQELPAIKAGSLIFIYIAGHGSLKQYTRLANTYLVLKDGVASEMPNNGFRLHELLDGFRLCQPVTILCFIDCCFASGVSNNLFDNDKTALSNLGVRSFILC